MTPNEDSNLIITSLQSKVEKLVHLHQKSQEDLKKVKRENQQLSDAVVIKDQQIKELEHKNKVLKIAKSVSGTDERKTEAKQKINELVREIERCISLLNR